MSFQQIIENAYKAIAESKFGMNSPTTDASQVTASVAKPK